MLPSQQLLVGASATARWGGLLAAVGVLYWLHKQVRDSWVAPRYVGVVRLRHPHPEFVAQARGYARVAERYQPELVPVAEPIFDTAPEPAPAPAPAPAGPPPGWYPDPGGTFAARWFDGSGWTEQVTGPAAPARSA